MNRVHFILGCHNHQPIGNFDFVFEKAYQQSYLPFLEAMIRHPKLQWNLHATGVLWNWLEHHHPEYIEQIVLQVRENRVEILTGGFYEPILSALPDADKAGQIHKLTRYIRQRFRVKPRGMWLAERVWEPHLAKVLHENGITYTLLDDTHFFSTGMTEDDMTGAYLTEEQGATLNLLPIRQDLRYAIPFKDPGETINLLRRHATPTGYKALAMFDDGEKFGFWPDTYHHVYEDGWLEKFLTVLESNGDWIKTCRISDYLDAFPPGGRVYLPTSSYYEMSEWTLPAASQEALSTLQKNIPAHLGSEASKRFLRGGYWRNFLTKYDESNNLHKKMLLVSDKVHRANEVLGGTLERVSPKAQKMMDALWAGQCNCAYWHGVFGGLYLPHLRQAIYRELLRAEQLADKVLQADEIIVVREVDFDKDGTNEILAESPDQNIYFSPRSGGSMFEWDLRSEGVNLLNVLTRRPEGYHRHLSEHPSGSYGAGDGVKTIHDAMRMKEPALEKRLFTDWYRRSSLLDHFFHPDTKINDFYRCQYGEQGDFVKTGYRVDVVRDTYPQVRLSRTGTVWSGDQRNTISVEKTISLLPPLGWQVIYRIENRQGPVCNLWFGCEMAFAFATQEHQELTEHHQQQLWMRRDEAFGLVAKVQFDVPTDLWEFPLHTVSLSEDGFEKTYQGTVLLAHMRVPLQPGQSLVRSWRVGAQPS
ncbi:MAG: alpha-amylase/4-alpha-glucanotransferase domain-containing protein [Elusimicrobiota bacterium]